MISLFLVDCNKMDLLYRNRWVGLLAVTVEILIEHVQVMSYGKRMVDPVYYTFNTKAFDTFDGMENIALRFSGSGFITVYIVFLVLSFLCFFAYLPLSPLLHKWNRQKGSFASPSIWFFDHIVFGVCFIPAVAAFAEVTYCDEKGKIGNYTSVTCWENGHLVLFELGFIGTGMAYFLAGMVFPAFKNERKAVDRGWVNELNFPGLFKLLEIGIIYFFVPAYLPTLGLIAHCSLVLYMLIFSTYAELHVESMKLAVLMAQMWIFACAQHVKVDSDKGSYMLIGWAPCLLFGYALLPLKSLLIKRDAKDLPIAK